MNWGRLVNDIRGAVRRATPLASAILPLVPGVGPGAAIALQGATALLNAQSPGQAAAAAVPLLQGARASGVRVGPRRRRVRI